MNVLRFLAIPALFLVAVAATYFVASLILESQTERIIMGRIEFYKSNLSSGVVQPIRDEGFPDITTAFGKSVLSKIMKGGDPETRFWAALIAAHNGRKNESIEAISDSISKCSPDTASEIRKFLFIYVNDSLPSPAFDKASPEDIEKLISNAAEKAAERENDPYDRRYR